MGKFNANTATIPNLSPSIDVARCFVILVLSSLFPLKRIFYNGGTALNHLVVCQFLTTPSTVYLIKTGITASFFFPLEKKDPSRYESHRRATFHFD